jgi:serine/threonine protein kinase/Tol biopolymer transport system component
MPLAAGIHLGPYEVISPLGAGGMGEVYKGRDTRLNRIVALKVLPRDFADDPDLRQRLEQEARAISHLDHPHICVLYDVGHQDGIDFLVMQYLEGQTLADRLTAGTVPLESALGFAMEIADALDRAHRQGIVHRDLKPANVMLTSQGVKVLDFGLAKSTKPAGTDADADATRNPSLTIQGTLLGTLHYMSPEQLEGHAIDVRSDIFAFGVVLYEILSGQRPFTGENQATVIASILGTEPAPVTTRRSQVPVLLDRIIRRCLAKDPEQRWQSMRDVFLELKSIRENPVESTLHPALPGKRRSRIGLALFACLAALASLVAVPLAIVHLRERPVARPPIRFTIAAPPQTSPSPLYAGATLSVSPDGRQVAFVSVKGESTQLWLRALDDLSAHALPGTEGATYPFWSPDSRALGFFARGKLKTIEIAGDQVHVLADAPHPFGGAWSSTGEIVFAPDSGSALFRVPQAGGSSRPATRLDAPGVTWSHRWPAFLPGGRRFAYVVTEPTRVFVASLDSPDVTELVRADSGVTWSLDHLLFMRGGTLFAQGFDSRQFRLTGQPYAVAEQVSYDPIRLRGDYSASDGGVLAYTTGGLSNSQLVWFDRKGTRLGPISAPANYLNLALSPDERRVAAARIDESGSRDIWLVDVRRDVTSRLTLDPAFDWLPLWSPDGTRVAFTSNREGSFNLYQKASNGLGPDEAVFISPDAKYFTDWSRNGQFVLFDRLDAKTNFDVWLLPLAGDRKPRPLVASRFSETSARFSPDANWIAYVSDESGRSEVWVQRLDREARRWQISNAGGFQPQWARDSAELFYIAPDRQMMTVRLKLDVTKFEATVPAPVFETAVPDLENARNRYAVTADGQRFLINTLLLDERDKPITILVNWSSSPH